MFHKEQFSFYKGLKRRMNDIDCHTIAQEDILTNDDEHVPNTNIALPTNVEISSRISNYTCSYSYYTCFSNS